MCYPQPTRHICDYNYNSLLHWILVRIWHADSDRESKANADPFGSGYETLTYYYAVFNPFENMREWNDQIVGSKHLKVYYQWV